MIPFQSPSILKLKVLIVFTLFLMKAHHVRAQVEYLRLSPAQTLTQRVGASDVTIQYSRPLMKGRKIFGGLVPYDKMWRTGANENTTIEFEHRVKIGTTEVPAGKYTLWTKPMEDKWEVYLYTDTNLLGVPDEIDHGELIFLITVKPDNMARKEESLVINLYNITEHAAELGIAWESTSVRIPIEFYTHEAMEAMIEKEMKRNKLDLSIAAGYYEQRDIKLEEALALQELAMQLSDGPNAWDYHSKGKILQKLGMKQDAKKAFEISLQLSVETDNKHLIKENKKYLSRLE